MPEITYVSHAGESRTVEVPIGSSVMLGAVNNGIDGIVAECGGACSCATCHCYIDPAWVDKIPPPEEMEKDMLECALKPRENSRLGCQITVTEELNGLVVRTPESQF